MDIMDEVEKSGPARDVDTEEADMDDPAEIVEPKSTVGTEDVPMGLGDAPSDTEEVQQNTGNNSVDNVLNTEKPPNAHSQRDLFDSEPNDERFVNRLPISKIKKTMKFDPEVTLANQDAVFLVSKATELFIEAISRQAGTHTIRGKRKTVQKRDVELAVDAVPSFEFLEGVLETM